LLTLAVVFVPLSLLSIGGGASLLADMEHQSVAVQGRTTSREFADLFAISRAAPGPGTMLSALIGWRAAGWAGAITATVALYLPPSLLACGAARLWERWRGSAWHSAIERGLAPIAAGLIVGRDRRVAGVVHRRRSLGSGRRGDGVATALAAPPSIGSVRSRRSPVRGDRSVVNFPGVRIKIG
jgi:chromate transporter